MGLDGRFLQNGRTLVPMRFQREERGGDAESQSYAFVRLLLHSLVCQEEHLHEIRGHESVRYKREFRLIVAVKRLIVAGYPFSI